MAGAVTHGSNSCYTGGCRLAECRLAHKIDTNRYRAKRVKRGGKITERGIQGGRLLVSSNPVRKQVGQLNAKLTLRRIGHLAGVSDETLKGLLHRHDKTTQATARAIESLWADYFGPLKKRTRTENNETKPASG